IVSVMPTSSNLTGAGGSIGSEICRQVMKYKPEKIVLLGHGENSIYTIEMELKEYYQENVEIIYYDLEYRRFLLLFQRSLD
ncbi:polysaccharide biosynthesis protein, partial [Bacillus sp. D-CC]